MDIRIRVGPGEFLDRISILKIKKEKIRDESKRKFIIRELDELIRVLEGLRLDEGKAFLDALVSINKNLWDIEDLLREKERKNEFDDEFIALARGVYRENDRRFSLKKKCNHIYGNKFQEVKSYENTKIKDLNKNSLMEDNHVERF